MTEQVKTRQQIADEYGVSRKTLYNWLKREGIAIKNGLVTPKEQRIIYEKFGAPQNHLYEQLDF
ncbi:MAG: helix-turn-helix domain-containing protein [Saprospiraceae bacterium]|nr:helix-turn-helix domain-containing protein [Saprospiraceae bacterium]